MSELDKPSAAVGDPSRRTPEACGFRSDPRGDGLGQTARCGLLAEVTGVSDPELLEATRVGRGACTLCCIENQPRPGKLNPTVASHVLRLLDQVEQRGGVSGCDIQRVQFVRGRTVGKLQRLGERKSEWRTPRYTRDCLHLSQRLPAEGAGRYACSHEMHHVTTHEACRGCPDYEPALEVGGGVSSWAVGVITAQRRKPTLTRTLASMAAAGWEEPRVFADVGTRLPRGLVPNERLVRRTARYFGWGNWFSMLNELLLTEPDADAYLLAEDDVLFCKGLRRYLERSLWPAERIGFVSLYAASHQDPGDGRGFYEFDGTEGLWGSLALVFPSAAARMFVRHPRVVNHRVRGPRSGEADQDIVAGMWAAAVELPILLHTPSLTQHIGETSAIWGEAASAEGNRVSLTFPGEEKDIGRIMAAIRGARRR